MDSINYLPLPLLLSLLRSMYGESTSMVTGYPTKSDELLVDEFILSISIHCKEFLKIPGTEDKTCAYHFCDYNTIAEKLTEKFFLGKTYKPDFYTVEFMYIILISHVLDITYETVLEDYRPDDDTLSYLGELCMNQLGFSGVKCTKDTIIPLKQLNDLFVSDSDNRLNAFCERICLLKKFSTPRFKLVSIAETKVAYGELCSDYSESESTSDSTSLEIEPTCKLGASKKDKEEDVTHELYLRLCKLRGVKSIDLFE